MADSRSGGSRLAGRAVRTGLPPVVRSVARVAWRLQLDPGPGIPDPPFVVASNHHSFLDPLLVGSVFRERVRFLGLVDLFDNHRWLDFALEVFEVIPLRRGVVPLGPVRAALSHLEQGGTVGLFPEGTRRWVFDPGNVLDGAAWLAARAGVPLVPVAISGTERVLGVDNRLRRGRVAIEVGPPLSAVSTRRQAVDDLTVRWAGWVSGALSQMSPD